MASSSAATASASSTSGAGTAGGGENAVSMTVIEREYFEARRERIWLERMEHLMEVKAFFFKRLASGLVAKYGPVDFSSNDAASAID